MKIFWILLAPALVLCFSCRMDESGDSGAPAEAAEALETEHGFRIKFNMDGPFSNSYEMKISAMDKAVTSAKSDCSEAKLLKKRIDALKETAASLESEAAELSGRLSEKYGSVSALEALVLEAESEAEAKEGAYREAQEALKSYRESLLAAKPDESSWTDEEKDALLRLEEAEESAREERDSAFKTYSELKRDWDEWTALDSRLSSCRSEIAELEARLSEASSKAYTSALAAYDDARDLQKLLKESDYADYGDALVAAADKNLEDVVGALSGCLAADEIDRGVYQKSINALIREGYINSVPWKAVAGMSTEASRSELVSRFYVGEEKTYMLLGRVEGTTYTVSVPFAISGGAFVIDGSSTIGISSSSAFGSGVDAMIFSREPFDVWRD